MAVLTLVLGFVQPPSKKTPPVGARQPGVPTVLQAKGVSWVPVDAMVLVGDAEGQWQVEAYYLYASTMVRPQAVRSELISWVSFQTVIMLSLSMTWQTQVMRMMQNDGVPWR
jgi:hypothetical protein